MTAPPPIVPARIDFSDAAAPRSLQFDDIYHARAGAQGQAEHVFLRGNGLPERWRGRRRFVILETGFGLGHNFLATWAAWRADAQACEHLHFVSVDLHPPCQADLQRALQHAAQPALAQQLVQVWPSLAHGLHALDFEGHRLHLLLAFGDVQHWLREWALQADAVFLDGFAPRHNPAMWDDELFARLPRLLAPGATAATWSAAQPLRQALARQGFVVERAAGFAAKHDMTVARYAPRFHAPPPLGLHTALPQAREVLIIGAGLAGSAAAWALQQQGLHCRVLDAAAQPAQGASGNVAGLFGDAALAQAGSHAQFIRAAARAARTTLFALLTAQALPGEARGVLRVMGPRPQRPGRADVPASNPEDEAVDESMALLSAGAAAELAGLPLHFGARHARHGGWLSPAALVRHWLQASQARFIGQARVQALRHDGGQWLALDGAGQLLAAAPVLVLANADAAAALAPWAHWPLQRHRGQISHVGAAPGLRVPHLPLADAGFVIPQSDGSVWCGATSARDDEEVALREVDHRRNLATLLQLTGSASALLDAPLAGRVGWRCRTPDRLPVVGGVPVALEHLQRHAWPTHARHMPRLPGLFVLSALGSRGITYAPICAQALASQIVGAPLPLPGSLWGSIDAARHALRVLRRR